MKKIFIVLVIVTNSISIYAGSWTCTEEVRTDAVFNLRVCSGSSRFACREKVVEKCVNDDTGETEEMTYKRFTGECVSSINGC